MTDTDATPQRRPDDPWEGEADEWGVGEWTAEVESPPRAWPSATAAYAAVLAVGGIGLVLMALVGWGQAAEGLFRPGAALAATSVCIAALLRAVLPEERAGMLVLRSRRIDVLVYGTLGVAAVVLAIVVPPPS